MNSPERQAVRDELARLKAEPKPVNKSAQDEWAFREFAVPFRTQMFEVQKRVFQQYWRSPVYLHSKLAIVTLVPLFIGFSFFKAGTSLQGLQNQCVVASWLALSSH